MLVRTDRLSLRPIEIGDVDSVVEVHADRDICRYIPPMDRQRGTRWVERFDRQWSEQGYGMFALRPRGKERVVGFAGLDLVEGEEVELGWVLRRDAWGNGFATEAARACAGWAFEEFRPARLISMIHPQNTRSQAVAKRLGMSLHHSRVFAGAPADVYHLSS